MGDTNFFSSIVKVLENPIQTFSQQKIPIIKLRAELPQIRKNRIIHLVFWGNLATNVKVYYQVNDYILIEGYLSLRNTNHNDSLKKNLRKVEITVLKVYPFLLNPDRQKTKV